jgi:hypothetical protein
MALGKFKLALKDFEAVSVSCGSVGNVYIWLPKFQFCISGWTFDWLVVWHLTVWFAGSVTLDSLICW